METATQTESQIMPANGIVRLASGNDTFAGQLAARERALASCNKGLITINENILAQWILSHQETISKLKTLIKNAQA